MFGGYNDPYQRHFSSYNPVMQQQPSPAGMSPYTPYPRANSYYTPQPYYPPMSSMSYHSPPFGYRPDPYQGYPPMMDPYYQGAYRGPSFFDRRYDDHMFPSYPIHPPLKQQQRSDHQESTDQPQHTSTALTTRQPSQQQRY